MRLVRGRLAAVSVRASFGAGAWVGAALGLVVGALLGAVLAWFAGTVLEWQRDLGFTLGVARGLLPLGEQAAALRWISSTWWLVVPAVALAFAIVSGLVGGLIAALLAAVYNRTPRHAAVVVELPETADEEAGIGTAMAEAGERATSRRRRVGTRLGRAVGRLGSPRTRPGAER
jgi:hypothetical protein